MDHDRPIEELKLPESGATVTLYANITTGDYRKIQRVVMESMRVKFHPENPKNPDIQDVSSAVSMDQEETVLSCLLVKIVDGAGNNVSNTTQFVYDLPVGDGNLLYDKINEISSGASLTKEAKKK